MNGHSGAEKLDFDLQPLDTVQAVELRMCFWIRSSQGSEIQETATLNLVSPM